MNRLIRIKLWFRYSRLGIAWKVFRGQPAIIGLEKLRLQQSLEGVLIVDTSITFEYGDGVGVYNCEVVRRKRSTGAAIEIDLEHGATG